MDLKLLREIDALVKVYGYDEIILAIARDLNEVGARCPDLVARNKITKKAIALREAVRVC